MITVGRVFTGSGSASKSLPADATQIEEALGYRPYPGSLNVRLEHPFPLPKPHHDVRGKRDWQFWPGEINGRRCHIMRPGRRGHQGAIEVVAPIRLREVLGLTDGEKVRVSYTGFRLGIVTSVFGDYGKFLPAWAESIAGSSVWPDMVTVAASGEVGEIREIWESSRGLLSDIPHQFVHQGVHEGMGAVRNLAVASTPTEWIMHLDADDVLLPDGLLETVELSQDADVVCLGAIWKRDGNTRNLIYQNVSPGRVLAGHHCSTSASPYRRRLWEQRPYVPGDYVDSALWIGFARLGARFVATTRPGYLYHQRPDGHHRSLTRDQRAAALQQNQRLREGKRG